MLYVFFKHMVYTQGEATTVIVVVYTQGEATTVIVVVYTQGEATTVIVAYELLVTSLV